MTRNAPAWIGIGVLSATASYLLAVHAFGIGAADRADAFAGLATAVALVAVIAGAAFIGLGQGVDLALRQTVGWLAAALTLFVVYAYRSEVIEVSGPLVAGILPSVIADESRDDAIAAVDPGSTVAISAGRGGHFFVEAMVNGGHVQFVADTGATLVVLTAEDALRVGFAAEDLDYRHRVHTANGVAAAAYVVLDEVAVGPITLNDVRASVAQPGRLSQSLLGMSFLSELASFNLRGDQLVLEQ